MEKEKSYHSHGVGRGATWHPPLSAFGNRRAWNDLVAPSWRASTCPSRITGFRHFCSPLTASVALAGSISLLTSFSSFLTNA